LAEWLYEAGVGEARAALVEDGRIVEARIERPGGVRVGAVLPAKLVERLPAFTRAETAQGEMMVSRVPAGTTLGQTLLVEVTREALPESGKTKLPRAQAAAEGAVADVGPDLLARCTATGLPVRTLHAHEPDALEAAGWSEVLDEALTGEIAFPGGSLRLSPTPAMALFDVDGPGATGPLAIAAATAVGHAVRRLDIGGSIGIDFPTLGNKAERQAVGDALDATLVFDGAGPFERTAVNGFGFLQIVRARSHASLPEILRADPAASEALALLRSIERTPPPVRADQQASARVVQWLARHPELVAELSRRTGVPISFAS
jgi:hypothetical protein